jgi:DNA adenine methylase
MSLTTAVGQARPFLKWAGGKRLLLKHIRPHVPQKFGRYFEPFLGGGALFFELIPREAFVSDMNPELINTYVQIRDNVDELIARLQQLAISAETFYKIRSVVPDDPMDRAVRFMYLNRTAYNGLYRVNLNGEFNVPFGCKPGTVLCQEDTLRAASLSLRGATISVTDFQTAVEPVNGGDFVYCDPPYTVKHNNNGFRKYNERIFSWADQVRLANVAHQLVKRGAHVIVSNAHHQDLVELYPGFQPVVVTRPSVIGGNLSVRGRIQEYLFVSA